MQFQIMENNYLWSFWLNQSYVYKIIFGWHLAHDSGDYTPTAVTQSWIIFWNPKKLL